MIGKKKNFIGKDTLFVDTVQMTLKIIKDIIGFVD